MPPSQSCWDDCMTKLWGSHGAGPTRQRWASGSLASSSPRSSCSRAAQWLETGSSLCPQALDSIQLHFPPEPSPLCPGPRPPWDSWEEDAITGSLTYVPCSCSLHCCGRKDEVAALGSWPQRIQGVERSKPSGGKVTREGPL